MVSLSPPSGCFRSFVCTFALVTCVTLSICLSVSLYVCVCLSICRCLCGSVFWTQLPSPPPAPPLPPPFPAPNQSLLTLVLTDSGGPDEPVCFPGSEQTTGLGNITIYCKIPYAFVEKLSLGLFLQYIVYDYIELMLPLVLDVMSVFYLVFKALFTVKPKHF